MRHWFSYCSLARCPCSLVNGGHDLDHGCLVDHVPGSWDRMEGAVCNIAMKPGRLAIGIYQAVDLPGDNDDGHLQVAIPITKRKSIRNHQP